VTSTVGLDAVATNAQAF